MDVSYKQMGRLIVAAALLAVTAGPPAPKAQALQAESADTAMTAVEIAARAAALGASADEQRDVQRASEAFAGARWTSATGDLTTGARAVVTRLEQAEAHGLDPLAYLPPGLARALEPPGAPGARITREAALTLALLRYMRDLHLGRVDPRRVGIRLQSWDEPHDFPAMLAEATAEGRVPSMLDALAPPWPVYHALVEARARYRALVAQAPPEIPEPVRAVKPGEDWEGVPAARARLTLFRDLAPGAADVRGITYDTFTADAVMRFQARHGLAADGVLGARTLAALRVTPAARVRQIDVALERLRWLPDPGPRRLVVVNIPMFELAAWPAGAVTGPPALAMKVIVGKAARTRTPVLLETLDHVIFRPPWNVPASITRDEVRPAVARDPAYLARQQMELVRGWGDDAPVVPADAAGLAALAAGGVRVRQRPGPHNALGLVKFVFPNRDNIYMHDTPARGLFARDRRDFSHGCIRVEDPVRLAEWVLDGVPGWTRDRVQAAMHGAATTSVVTSTPIDVLIVYVTAGVDPATGAVLFADDIYGLDATLARALATAR